MSMTKKGKTAKHPSPLKHTSGLLGSPVSPRRRHSPTADAQSNSECIIHSQIGSGLYLVASRDRVSVARLFDARTLLETCSPGVFDAPGLFAGPDRDLFLSYLDTFRTGRASGPTHAPKSAPVDTDPSPGDLDAALDNLDPEETPSRDAEHFRRIIAAKKALAAAEAELRGAVRDARAAGDSWTVIGAALDTSRQAAYQRFGKD